MPKIVTAALTVAVIAVVGASLPAEAATQCKAAISGLGFGQAAAKISWRNQVKSKYGSTWTNFALARNVRYGQSGPAPVQFSTVTAQPCRRT